MNLASKKTLLRADTSRILAVLVNHRVALGNSVPMVCRTPLTGHVLEFANPTHKNPDNFHFSVNTGESSP